MFDHAELPKALLTINQWTYRYGVSRAVLYELMKAKEIEHIKIGNELPKASGLMSLTNWWNMPSR